MFFISALVLFDLCPIFAWDYLRDDPSPLPISKLVIAVPPFIAWKTVTPIVDVRWQSYEISGNQIIKPAKVLKPLSRYDKSVEPRPICSDKGGSLSPHESSTSPDHNWSIRLKAVRTFSEDIKNIHLRVTNIREKRENIVAVPGHSIGETCPLFWSNEPAFYFLNLTGDIDHRSYRLMCYDPVKNSFKTIGITNGRAYLSPDCKWVLWETGKLIDPCASTEKHPCNQMVAYDIENRKNHWLTDDTGQVRFSHWK